MDTPADLNTYSRKCEYKYVNCSLPEKNAHLTLTCQTY